MALSRMSGRLGLPAAGNLAVTGVIANCLLIGSYLVSPTKFMPRAAVPVQVVTALQSLQSVTDEKRRSWRPGGIVDKILYCSTNCQCLPMAVRKFPRPPI